MSCRNRTAGLVAIYALSNCAGEVRYIGKAVDPRYRFLEHKRLAKHGKTPLYCWLRREIEAGRSVALSVLEWVTEAEWPAAECRLIAAHRAGGRLLNLADGGNAPKNGYLMGGRARRITELKMAMHYALRSDLSDDFKDSLRAKMRLAARNNPALFGKWATL